MGDIADFYLDQGDDLFELDEDQVGLESEMLTAAGRATFPAKRAEKPHGPGPCPICGQQTVLREGPYGYFYGCKGFPKCRGTRKAEQVFYVIVHFDSFGADYAFKAMTPFLTKGESVLVKTRYGMQCGQIDRYVPETSAEAADAFQFVYGSVESLIEKFKSRLRGVGLQEVI